MRALFFVVLVLWAAPSVAADVPASLAQARQRAEELRFEEAVVEYNRYLGEPNRPVRERAQALLELGFVHLVLNDEASARQRATEALELDPTLTLPPEAPAKQLAFLESVRAELNARPKLELLPQAGRDAARVRVKLTDPSKRVSHVLLRHGLGPGGPYSSLPMKCQDGTCQGFIPTPAGVQGWTTWYYVEADDNSGNTLARAGSAASPIQVFVVPPAPWYDNPLVYGGGAAALVGAAAIFYVISNATPAR